MKRNTRQDIVDAFIAAVEQTSLSKVRIADLIAGLGINRNTFYYHFSNKYDVAIWVLRTELDAQLRAAVPARNLVCSRFLDNDPESAPLAYYVHVETGARTLDASEFMRALVRCTQKRPLFYRKLFSPHELDFQRRVGMMYQPVIERDIDFILDGRYMPQVTKRMISQSVARSIVFAARFCLEDSEGALMLDERINPFWNIIHESLYNAIQQHPINRYTPRAAGQRPAKERKEKCPPPASSVGQSYY